MSHRATRRFLLGASTGAAVSLAAPQVRAQSNFLDPARIRMGYAPYISAGPYLIAEAKGYFRRLNIEIVPTSHVDGSLSLPALAAGELDVTGATISAGLFNLMARGLGIKLFMERGRETPGMGSNAILVSNELWERGFRNKEGYRLARGQAIGISSRGSVAQYIHTLGIEAAGLSVNDVDWRWGMAPGTSLPLLQQNRIGLMNLPLPGAYAAQDRGVGRVATWSDELAPGMVLACSLASERFLRERHSAVVRFCMAIMQGNRDFMAAAQDGNPEILRILAEGTRLTPEVINSTRPRWTFMQIDGMPNLPSIVAQQRFWRERTDLLARTVPEDQIFDTRAITEAWQRLQNDNPFG
jgi:NitT/TauT family transport system substrate-binding protein